MISDFTTNLIKEFLCQYTEGFAKKHISKTKTKQVAVERARFNFKTRVWMSRTYTLPWFRNDYVILTPAELLTKDENWINKEDFVREYSRIPVAIPDQQIRDQIDSYFRSILPRDAGKADESEAIRKTAIKFPELFDYFIKLKEETGDEAETRSIEKVNASISLYIEQFGELVEKLHRETDFYKEPAASREAAQEKILFLKDIIEKKAGIVSFTSTVSQ